MRRQGIPIYEGVVCGKALVYRPYDPAGQAYEADALPTPAEGVEAYRRAVAQAGEELRRVMDLLARRDPEKAKIFEAHQGLLEDVAMDEQIRMDIAAGKPVSQAILETYDLFIGILSQADNAFTQERVADLRDVRGRILRCLAGLPERNLALLPEPCVVFARELFPSDTATIDRENVLAIVTEAGGVTSHTAIVARSYGIPTVLGVEGILDHVGDGEEVIVDGAAGAVLLGAGPAEKEACLREQAACLERRRQTEAYRDRPAVTLDGVPIAVEVNISSVDGLSAEEIATADGVGLMRSEFLYMQNKEALPGEEQQFRAYRAAAEAFGGKPVILRTLDIGGDKQLPYLPLPREDNPFLGRRALRLCLEEQDLFRTQLRAALRATRFGNLWIMFPMVGSLDDFRRAKAIVQEVMAELDAEGIPYDPAVKLGIMIEIPSIALLADKAAREVDFASIGTNDLCQYLTAADRMNEAVAPYYQTYHPALFRTIRFVAEAFQKAGKPLSICGEMGGDPLAALALVGLGLRMLSMSAGNLARIKRVLTGVTTDQARELALAACGAGTAAEARALLERAAARIAAGG